MADFAELLHPATAQKLRAQGATSVRYHHAYYGCDSGCCGHEIVVLDKNENVLTCQFDFMHDKDELEYTVKALANVLGCAVRECEFGDYC